MNIELDTDEMLVCDCRARTLDIERLASGEIYVSCPVCNRWVSTDQWTKVVPYWNSWLNI